MTDTATEIDTSIWTTAAFRARAAQERIVDLRAQLDGEIEKRDRAVREAVDGGAPKRQLANMVGISKPGLYGILGTAPV